MKKIFINPDIRVFNVETEIICASGDTTDMPGSGDDWNQGEAAAPVRMDIFNYGGLK